MTSARSFTIPCLAILCFTAALLPSIASAENNWTHWRGPLYNGHSTEKGLPVKWSSESVTWKSDLKGRGQSSPIILGDKIFLTTALEQGRQRVVFCVDRTRALGRQPASARNTSRRASPRRMGSSRASTVACATSCSTRRYSSPSVRPARSSPAGSTTTTPSDRTRRSATLPRPRSLPGSNRNWRG